MNQQKQQLFRNRAQPVEPLPAYHQEPEKKRSCCGCWSLLLLTVMLVIVVTGFLLIIPGRSNLLILGLDRRPGEGDAVRADVLLVVTADPSKPVAGLMSIPRDLYLEIPDQGLNRINTAHVFGELYRPGYGPVRTMHAIEQNMAIDLDGWIRLDFDGFEDIVDAAGGITIDVPRAIVDYQYPTDDFGTMVLEIPAGEQKMDGEVALQYVRTRHDSTDVERAERQQQVIQALVEKMSRPWSWFRIPWFIAAIQRSMDKDLSIIHLMRIGLAVLRTGQSGIDRLVLDTNYATPTTTSSGAWVLNPQWDMLLPAERTFFGTSR